MNVKTIFLEVLKEAKDGIIKINDLELYINFNTIINNQQLYYNDKNILSLNISNLDYLIAKLEEYISLEKKLNRKSLKYLNTESEYIKLLITYLFVNATSSDFFNFTAHVQRYIEFLNNQELCKFNDGVLFQNNNILEDELLYIKNSKQSIMMETPNKLEILFVNKNDNHLFFMLPEISYAIANENGKKVCYIYSILNKEDINNLNDDKLLKYKKKISRLLYKLNSGILKLESDEYKNNNINYYVENITDVSVSSVLSLYIFLNLVKDTVDVVKGVSYLPVRYYSRENAACKINNIDKRNQLDARNNNIQKNLTDKFIRTFRRTLVYMPEMSIDSYPYEFDEFITCTFSKKNNLFINNELIESLNIK